MALILFDYDGVLADTLDDLIQFGQEACDRLGVQHVVTKDDLANLDVMSFSTYGRACGVPEPFVDEFVKISLSLFAEKKTPPGIFVGLGDVIRRLSVKHVLGVVTTNSSQNVNAFLAEHDLAGCFQAVYGVDTPGSKAQKISLARDRFLTETVFMIGDSLSDVRAAKEASVACIAVAWGHQSVEKLQGGQPEYVIHAPHELIEVVEG